MLVIVCKRQITTMAMQHAICVTDLLDSQKCKECYFTEDPLDEVCCKQPRLLTRQNSNSLPSLIVSVIPLKV